MKSFASIPKFCISLKRSTGRRRLMIKEFKKHRISVQLWDAVDGKKVKIPELSVKNKYAHAAGIYGCMMSHLEVMRYAVDKGMKAICVFEDDIVLSDDFKKRIKYIESLRNFSFDILSLGGHFPSEERIGNNASPTRWNHIYRIVTLSGSYGYIINKKAMEFCIRNLTYNYGIDEMLGSEVYRRFRSFAFLPFMVGIRSCKSEIVGKVVGYKDYFYEAKHVNLKLPFVAPEGLDRWKMKERIVAEQDRHREEWLKNN